MLCDIRTRTWDPDLCELLHVPISALPETMPQISNVLPSQRPP